MTDTLDDLKTSPLTADKLALASRIKRLLDEPTNIDLKDGGTLYPNQLTAIRKLYQFLIKPDGEDIGYIVQPTGSGKTLIMALIVKLFDVDTLFLVPRVNLLEYTRDELISVGIDANDIGIIGGDYNQIGRKITLSTYQSHLSRAKKDDYQTVNKQKKLILCDEAHTALGEKTRASISRVLVDYDIEAEDTLNAQELNDQERGLAQVSKDYEDQAFVLGFTATPKLALKHVEQYFRNEIARETLINMLKAGVLAKLRVTQLSGDMQRGEEIEGRRISQEQQVKILSRNDAYKKLIDTYERIFEAMLADDQIPRAVARCTNITEANKFAELLRKRGYKAELCTSRDEDAKTPDQQRVKLTRLEAEMIDGKLDVIVTVDKLAMGWNFPAANIAIDATASASPAKIIQFLGRILRRAKNKKYAILICMSWLVQNAKQRKPSNENAEVADPKDVSEEDKQDPNYDPDGNLKSGQRYDFFRALLESGEDIEEALSLLTDESGQAINCKLDEIKNTAEMDRKYFSAVENVMHDLNGYAQAAGVSITRLTTGKPYRDIYIVCANGEETSLNRYLIRAMAALGLSSGTDTLTWLKSLVGLETKKACLELDAAYFRCPECVRADLQNYADVADITIAELATNPSYNSISVTCRNGDLVKWQTYLRRAKAALGFESAAPALIALKKLIGLETTVYSKMDAIYFRCSECIRADLQNYADTMSVNIDELSTDSPGDALATCVNREPVKWQTYLRRASVALGLDSKAAALVKLKKLIGLEVKSIEMDEVYFRCVDCVRKDLRAYADAANVSIPQLTTATRYNTISVTCSNSESVSFDAYRNRAKRILGSQTATAALVDLKRLINQHDVFAPEYFAKKENVIHDLNAFATVAGVAIANLSTASNSRSNSATCANGETVTWSTFLTRAMKALNIATPVETLLALKTFASTE